MSYDFTAFSYMFRHFRAIFRLKLGGYIYIYIYIAMPLKTRSSLYWFINYQSVVVKILNIIQHMNIYIQNLSNL